MADRSNIEWTDATWNPVRGLAEKRDGKPRWTGKVAFVESALLKPLKRRTPTTYFVNSMSDLFHESIPDEWIDRIFAVMALCPQHVFQVLTKRPERMRAYLSICRDSKFSHLVAAAPGDSDSLATKWPGWPLPNVWAGTSVEDQPTADARIPELLATPAAVRFLSLEPLLAFVNCSKWIERVEHCSSCGTESDPQKDDRCPSCGAENGLITTWGEAQADRYRTGERYDVSSAAGRADIDGTSPMLDWVIVGGESGPYARDTDFDAIRSVVEQCAAAGVACFVKQLGRRAIMNRSDAVQPAALGAGWSAEPGAPRGIVTFRDRKGGDPIEWPIDVRVRQMPGAGRHLDGALHDALPEVRGRTFALEPE